jgi:hypothetical protein
MIKYLLVLLLLSCSTTPTVLYVGLRPAPKPAPGLLRLAEDRVRVTASDGTVFFLELSGSYYLVHEADLESIIKFFDEHKATKNKEPDSVVKK